jgi:hypothetical protein
MKSYLFLLLLALLATATSAHAQILDIGVQFQGGGSALSSSGTAGVISQGNFNVITGNNVSDASLVDASGTLTAVTLTLASSDNWNTGTGNANANATLLSGKIGAGYGGSASFTLNNLAAGTYNLIVYTENNDDDKVGTYSVTGNSTSYSIADQNGADYTGTFVLGTNTTNTVAAAQADIANYVEFVNVTVDSSGTLTLTAAQMPGAFSGTGGADFSGFQLQSVPSVPEPATYALLGFALVLLIAVQRGCRVKLVLS